MPSSKRVLLSALALILSLTCSIDAACPVGDVYPDCTVNLLDLRDFAVKWLDGECLVPGCSANIDGIPGVDMEDFALLAENWLSRGTWTLVINEFMAENNGTKRDPADNDYEDWIELYNYGDDPIDIGGMYVTDDSHWSRIPVGYSAQTTIMAGGYLLLWADSEPEQGPLHLNFGLGKTGDMVGLYDGYRNPIDSITFGPLAEGWADKSYGRLPDANDHWEVFGIGRTTPGQSNRARPVEVLISEIMYHSGHALNTPENIGQEYIELYNKGQDAVNVGVWRFTNGVDFVIPGGVQLGSGGYLVVAADVNVFTAKYPGVTNVVGGWTGRLSNSGEAVELVDSAGVIIDRVEYADEGDWAVRQLGPLEENNQRGWEWSDQTDGGGKSLELINAALPNEYGQNWAASSTNNGTPGRVNSAVNNNIAPLILDVEHFPIIPGPSDTVTVTARIIDEQPTVTAVRLHYRIDRSIYQSVDVYPHYNASDYNDVAMFDDGAHGDGAAGDGLYGVQIPAYAHGAIVEFFVEARDAAANTRTWPAPSLIDSVPQQVTNLLYQVDGSFDPGAWAAGDQPIYYVIMTEMERARLEDIRDHTTQYGPDSQMNATFISVDGVDMKLRYNLGIRNRGHGTRSDNPMNYHVNFPHDRPWKDVTAINLITNYSWVWVPGGAVYRMAGIAQPDSFGVQVRVNGQNLAPINMTRTQGSYAHVEVVNSDWAENHFPDDPAGNAYKCMRAAEDNPADLRYQGQNPTNYRDKYSKETNSAEENWSDLIQLTYALSTNTPDSNYVEAVNRNLNVEQWLRFFAVNNLVNNRENSIGTGSSNVTYPTRSGDEYFMYRGIEDPWFLLIQHDLECMFGQGDETAQSLLTAGIFRATTIPAVNRFLKHPQFVPRYYWHLKNLAETTFSAEQFNPFIDNILGNWVPADRIASMKSSIAQFNTYILSVIPLTIAVTSAPTPLNGYYHTTSNLASLAGQANAVNTRRVTVNGLPAVWTAWQATWSISNVNLLPGINRVVIQAFDANDEEVDRYGVDIWRDTGSMTTKAGGTLSADEVWTAAAGPYHVTGNITIPAGRTLSIEPGATVFLDSNCGFIVYGRLAAQGTEYRRIRFTRVPGTTTQWAGLQFPNTKQDNIIAYADLEFGGYRSHWITTGNNNASAVGPTARLTVDHATFSGSDTQYFSIWDPQVIIRNSVFTDLGSHYMCMAERMPADGWFIIESNIFGHTHGDTDIFHLNSVSVKGGPVAEIINNVFTGGGDDLIDDNETDSHIEGNLFMHANVGNSGRSASAAVTTGPGGGSASANNLESQHLTVVRNIFYHNDYGVLCKTGAYAQIYNNVFIQNAGAILLNEFVGSNPNQPGRAAYVESCIFWNNGPEVDGTPSDNGTGTFINPQDTQLSVNNSIIKSQFLNLGSGNIDADPLLVDADRELYVDTTLPRFSTGFPGFADGGYLLEGMVPDVHLRRESAARGAGFNNVDMGPYVPTTASIGGVPASPTWRTNATLIVGGTDVDGYKYRVAGPGFDNTWSVEMARMMPVTALTRSGLTATATVASHGFANGNVVEIIGADRAEYNGQFAVFAVTPNTFSYTLASAVDLLHPDHLDVWVRRHQPIQLPGLTNGVYTVSVIKKNSMGLWQDENQPTTATWTVDGSFAELRINEILAHTHGSDPDIIELYYDGPGPINLAGMSLSDNSTDPGKFVFSSANVFTTIMNPGDYMVLYGDLNTGVRNHIGFGLLADGEALYLYDKAKLDGSRDLIDSVEFGPQINEFSIGRVGWERSWKLNTPTFGMANIVQPLGNPDTLKINEWLANGQVLFDDDFIELYNPHSLPVALDGMYLTDNPITQPGKHRIVPLSFIPPQGYTVFRANDGNGPSEVDFKLSADGEMMGLFDADLKMIDQVLYGPQTTDVSQGRAPDGSSNYEFFELPTPGVANTFGSTIVTTSTLVPENSDKRVRVPVSVGDVGATWNSDPDFADSGWTLCTGGPGGVGYDRTSTDYDSLITLDVEAQMYNIRNTCYVRIPFTVNADDLADVTGLTLKTRYDDGYVAYINGVIVDRRNFAGTPAWDSGSDSGHEAVRTSFDVVVDISDHIGDLRAGKNVLAIHAMNNAGNQSDFVISAEMDVTMTKIDEEYPFFDDLEILAGLRITELMYHSPSGSNFDYIELQNISDKVLKLDGVQFLEGVEFVFPNIELGAGEYVVVVSNLAAFRSMYGMGPRVAGVYSGGLSGGGEKIVLTLAWPLDAAIMRFGYSDRWYPTTDGGGQSLHIIDATAHPATWDEAASWRAAAPTPGAP